MNSTPTSSLFVWNDPHQTDPGLMVLSLRDVFRYIARDSHDKDYTVECSYTEVYNELVYDLLVPNSGALELREDPEKGPTVSGLTHVKVEDERQIFSLLREGNARRKTEETGANAVSSRSHAVLEIWVTRSERNHYCKSFSTGKLALVDLAGAERASETNNRGQQLRDGANINRSLLSLANCINALGKRKKKGFVFVPFRDSKLTRILKDGLCGNSRTVMVATVSGSSHQYEHTVNTLKYADRAKEIKTLVQENRGTVETHIAEYQRMIDALQEERRELKAEVSRLSNGGGGGVTGTGGGSSTAGGGVTGVNGRGTTSHASQSQSQSSPENSATSTYMSAQEVEKFAQELAEATDACAKAQRVLLESMHEPEPSTPNVGRASKKYAAAASALEALAPVNLAVDVAMITHSGAGASSRSSSRPSTGGSRAAAAPVSASDLAVLHARAALAVAADYDNLALDARDKLIEDQRQTIQYLMRLLQTRANIVDEDDLDLPENCGISQLDARYRALTRDWESSKSKKNGKKGKKQSETTTLATDGHGASVVPLGAIRIEAEALAARARATESNGVVANGGNKHSRKHSFGGGGGFELEYDVSELNLAEVDSIDDSISDRSGSSRSVSPPGGVNAAIGAPNGCLSPVHENVAKNGGGGSDRPRGGQKAAKAAKAATAEKAHAKPSPYAPGGGGGGVGGGASRRDSIAKRLNRVMTKQKARKEAAAA